MKRKYKVFPFSGLVIGFQYKDNLRPLRTKPKTGLQQGGIAASISDSYKILQELGEYRDNPGLLYRDRGLRSFASHPANELFNLSVSLEHIFNKNSVSETEEN